MEGMVWCVEKKNLLKESAPDYCLWRLLFKDSPDGAGCLIGIYLLQTDSPDGAGCVAKNWSEVGEDGCFS